MKKRFFTTVLFVLFLGILQGGFLCHAADSDPLVVNIDIEPGSISLKEERGARITCTIVLPDAYRGLTIDPQSVTLGDTIVADSVTTYQDIAIVKFKRSDLINFLKKEGHDVPSTLKITLKGSFPDGKLFVGNDVFQLTTPPKVYTYTRPDKYSRGKLTIK